MREPARPRRNATRRPVQDQARQGVELITSGELRRDRTHRKFENEVPWDGLTLGEIVVRGNVVMEGYYNDPEATAAAFAGGWFHSGDGAVVHPDGDVEIRDRFKDVIISGGENISSVEVEGVLLQHPRRRRGRGRRCAARKSAEVPRLCGAETGRRGHRGGVAGVRAEPACALQGATRCHVCPGASKDGNGQDPEVRVASGPVGDHARLIGAPCQFVASAFRRKSASATIFRLKAEATRIVARGPPWRR